MKAKILFVLQPLFLSMNHCIVENRPTIKRIRVETISFLKVSRTVVRKVMGSLPGYNDESGTDSRRLLILPIVVPSLAECKTMRQPFVG